MERVFDAWSTELRCVPVDDLDRRALCDLAQASARLRSALDSFDSRTATALDSLQDDGPGSSTMFRAAARCSQREADRRARRSVVLREMPATAEALASGTVSAEHVDTLVRAAELTSPSAVDQSNLLAKASRRPADLLERDAREWARRHQLGEDLADRQRRCRSNRRLAIFDNELGMTVLHAEFDPVTGAEVRAALSLVTEQMYRADGGRDGAHEARTPGQRRADALAAILTGDRPDESSSPPVRNQMIVIAHADGTAEIPQTGPIDQAQLQRLACTSDFYGLVFSGDGRPLWHGRRVRLATDDQWRALVVRDGGRIGCNAAPSRCEAHHVIPWSGRHNGPTDIDNLVLVCSHHHHLIHDQGWSPHREPASGWRIDPPP